MKDLYNNLAPVMLLEAQDLASTDTKSSLLDLAGYEGALIIVQVGALTGVDGSNYLTPTLQECATTADADFTSVAAGNIEGAFTAIDAAAEDSLVQVVGYKGTSRYIRVLLDYTGSGISAGIVGVIGILGKPRHAPVTTPGTAVAAT